MSTALAMAALAAATLVSEDATAVGAGLAVRDGHLDLLPALVACAGGIYVGDIGLWAAGRLGGRRALGWRRVRERAGAVQTLGSLLDRHPALAILGSRMLPGTRLPLYVAAGATGMRPGAFFLWTFIAVLLWTPLIVGLGVLLGEAVARPLGYWAGGGWAVRGVLLVAVVAGLRAAGPAAPAATRLSTRLSAWSVAIERWRRWEFWPAWLFNLPVVCWVLLLGLRHRGLTVFTLANPGIPDGGFVGESKSAILATLPPEWVLPWAVIDPAPVAHRLAALSETMARRGWRFPLVFKPDVGQRGAAVRWVDGHEAARAYFEALGAPVIVQVPHDGPYEAGVFYVRHPSEPSGRIFSITDKRFPVVTGDGTSTLGTLVEGHERYRLQAAVFRARLAGRWDQVPGPGERVALGRAGNHCQGTEFLDGRWLATPALERRIDAIARQVPGFCFGRFDVRYRDRGRFMAGEDLAIVELNGVTSEATHIYDPAASLVDGWRTLMRQWSLAFAIGAAHRKAGLRPPPIRRLLAAAWRFARQPGPSRLAD